MGSPVLLLDAHVAKKPYQFADFIETALTLNEHRSTMISVNKSLIYF